MNLAIFRNSLCARGVKKSAGGFSVISGMIRQLFGTHLSLGLKGQGEVGGNGL